MASQGRLSLDRLLELAPVVAWPDTSAVLTTFIHELDSDEKLQAEARAYLQNASKEKVGRLLSPDAFPFPSLAFPCLQIPSETLSQVSSRIETSKYESLEFNKTNILVKKRISKVRYDYC
jgi:hypothetical protein